MFLHVCVCASPIGDYLLSYLIKDCETFPRLLRSPCSSIRDKRPDHNSNIHVSTLHVLSLCFCFRCVSLAGAGGEIARGPY